MATNWFDIFNIKPRFFFCIFATCIVILALPDYAATFFRVDEFRNSGGAWIGGVGITSFFFGVAQCLPIWHEQVKGKIRKRRNLQKLQNSLESLTPDENVLLTYCLYRNKQSFSYNGKETFLHTLVGKGIIRQAHESQGHESNEYVIVDAAWNEMQRVRNSYLPDSVHSNADLMQVFDVFDQKTKYKSRGF